MKKEKVTILIIIIALIIPLVSAQFNLREGTEQLLKQIQDFSEPLLKFLLGVDSYDEFFFTKVLLFILLIVVIFSVLKNIEIFRHYLGAQWILSIIISLLAVRYLISINIINAILLPYGALGIAITILLPLVIFFYFVHNSIRHSRMRMLSWILYGLFFIGLWWQRSVDIGNFGWIYGAGIIGVLIAIIFDKQIH